MDSPAVTSFYNTLSQLATISDGFFQALRGHLTEQTCGKNTEITFKDLQKNAAYFIYSGLCKTCYFNELGKEVVTGFWWEKMFLISKDQNASKEADHLLFLEDTVLLTISPSAVEALFATFAETRLLSHKLYAIERKRLRERAELLMLPAGEAYAQVQRNFPARRLKLQDIAHFLGVRPFTLSRIRSKL